MVSLNDQLKKANHIVFMTGAGISTHSGIPDFRSQNGLYAHHPESTLSHANFKNNPQGFYEFTKKYMTHPNAKPNIIHYKMAQFTRKQKAVIITQNADGLHLKAGADPERLIEFHGNHSRIYCTKCKKQVPLKDYLTSMYHKNCGGILRPDVVLFDEPIKEENLLKSILAIKKADLIIIAGTSFVVQPFASLIQYRNPETPLIAINKNSIPLPKNSHMITNNAAEEFKKIDV